MFGHDDHDENDKSQDDQQVGDQQADDVVKPTDAAAPADDNWQHPGPPPSDDELAEAENDADNADEKPAAEEPADEEKPGAPAPSTPASFSLGAADSDTPADTVPANTAPTEHASDNDLIDLKQEALTKLSPLVDHLDQSPEEKFRTLMMMIQASDDQSLVRQAYETALKIDDEKDRAQALLDIVNEINYFTQNPGNASAE